MNRIITVVFKILLIFVSVDNVLSAPINININDPFINLMPERLYFQIDNNIYIQSSIENRLNYDKN